MYKKIEVRSVLNKKKIRDSWFLDDYTLNLFQGCSFNCQYCYIRGSKYGVNMSETLAVKVNSLQVLDKQLSFREKKGQFGIIAFSSATDPYLRIEESLRMTEGALQIIHKHQFPVLMITKSPLITRDIPLLRRIDHDACHAADLATKLKHGAIISFSFSSLDNRITRALEPGAPEPKVRMDALKRIKDEGFLVGVNLMPLLPYISDTNESLEEMISTLAAVGADYVLAGSLTLFGTQPADSRTLYYQFLARNFPQHLAAYDSLFKSSFFPSNDYQRNLSEKVSALCKKYRIRDRILE